MAARAEHRLGVAGIAVGLLQALRVVREAERIDGPHLRIVLLCGAVIQEDVDIVHRADAAMVLAVGTDVEIAYELLAQVRVPAGLALLPCIGRNLEALSPGDTRLLLLPEPGHGAKCGRYGRGGTRERQLRRRGGRLPISDRETSHASAAFHAHSQK